MTGSGSHPSIGIPCKCMCMSYIPYKIMIQQIKNKYELKIKHDRNSIISNIVQSHINETL